MLNNTEKDVNDRIHQGNGFQERHQDYQSNLIG